jgi:hypothetical protein
LNKNNNGNETIGWIVLSEKNEHACDENMIVILCSEREIMMFIYLSANGKLKREGGALQMLLRLNYDDDDDHLINEISVAPSSLDT